MIKYKHALNFCLKAKSVTSNQNCAYITKYHTLQYKSRQVSKVLSVSCRPNYVTRQHSTNNKKTYQTKQWRSLRTSQGSSLRKMFTERSDLKNAERVVIKLGSAIIVDTDNNIALGRLASIVEQIAELQLSGRECLIVTSGAVDFGKRKLTQEHLMSLSMRQALSPKDTIKSKQYLDPSMESAAAVGQSVLMSLYEAMFFQYGVRVAQVLVTPPDFNIDNSRHSLIASITELISLNIIPILNANDVVAPLTHQDVYMEFLAMKPEEYNSGDLKGNGFRKVNSLNDNDSLAARLSFEMAADLMLILSDTDGLYSSNILMHTYVPKLHKNTTGINLKELRAAEWALARGVPTVIYNGTKGNTISDVLEGRMVGTFLTSKEHLGATIEDTANNARQASKTLQLMSAQERSKILFAISSNILARQTDILDANATDIDNAQTKNLSSAYIEQLRLTKEKLQKVSDSVLQAANNTSILGKILRRTKISEEIELKEITVPLGVILVAFDSNPGYLPQAAAMAIATGNGILLKGDRNAKHSNKILFEIVKESIGAEASKAVSLVDIEVSDVIQLEGYIDLIVPRGSPELVQCVRDASRSIPVLGTSHGICHVYIDKSADPEKSIKVVKDSKCGNPNGLNAMDTLLVHSDHLENTKVFLDLCDMLKEQGVQLYAGPELYNRMTFGPPLATSMKHDYNELACNIEVVDSLEEAVEHIHQYGSGQTDVIVTEDSDRASAFQNALDSACVFHNISTRFSDGYRLGLGGEIGINTSRIHTRGPFGIEGLLTTKWLVTGNGDTVQEYMSGEKKFTHEMLVKNESTEVAE